MAPSTGAIPSRRRRRKPEQPSLLVPVGDWLAQLQYRKVSGLPAVEYGLNDVGRQESCPQDAASVTTADASPLGDLRQGVGPAAQQLVAPAMAQNDGSNQFIVQRAALAVGRLLSRNDLGSTVARVRVKRNFNDLRYPPGLALCSAITSSVMRWAISQRRILSKQAYQSAALSLAIR